MVRRWLPAPMRRRRIARGTIACALLAALAVPGCGKEDDVTPAPDCGGSNMIAFASDRNGRSQVFLYDTQLAQYRLLTGLDDGVHPDRDPSITRDARYIAFESTRGTSGADLFVYDRCAAAIAPVSGLNSAGDETDPAFTGDGFRLAYARDTLGSRRIRLYDGQLDRFVPLPGIDAGPSFEDWGPSPDQTGARIAFVSNRNGNDDILVYDASGDSLLDLPNLNSPGQETDPWLTPDGAWLAFASSRAGGAGLLDIYLYDMQTKTFITLDAAVNTPQDEHSPTTSIDSNVIVFASDRTGTLGGLDLWLTLRSTPGTVIQPSASGSSSDDETPCLVWP